VIQLTTECNLVQSDGQRTDDNAIWEEMVDAEKAMAVVQAATRGAGGVAGEGPFLAKQAQKMAAVTASDQNASEGPARAFDIDADDRADQFCVTEYTEEIYAYLRRDEVRSLVSHDYMSRQPDINAKMRVILNDWLVEVHLKFKLRQETLYLCFQLIDRFLETTNVQRQKLQLVGVTGLMLASKYEEIYPPEVRDYVYICDNAYTREEILLMEQVCANVFLSVSFCFAIPCSVPSVRSLCTLSVCGRRCSQSWVTGCRCPLSGAS
jgi:hypothetical protein